MNPSVLAVLLIAFLVHESSAGLQSYAAKGKFLCGTAPASGVKVKLIDLDTGFDDVLDTKVTGADGSFFVEGQTSELTSIDVVLKAYHDCNDGITPGQRRLKMTLPDKYIKKGGLPTNPIDVGTINLEPKHHGEERDYI